MKKKTLLLTFILAALFALCGGAMAACSEAEVPETQKTATGMKLDLKNAKTEFYVDDTFSTLGLGAVISYDDGTSELKLVDSENFGTLAPDLTTVGRKKVTVNYAGFMEQYTVVVSRIDGLALQTRSVQKGFVAGDEFTSEGLSAELTITTVDENDAEIAGVPKSVNATDLTVTAPDLTAPGVKEVTVSYGKYAATYPIYVLPDVADTDVIQFTGESDLSLYITAKTGGGSAERDATAEGWFVLLNRDGTFQMYETSISYTAAGGKNAFTGEVQASLSDDGFVLQALIGGKTYTVSASVYRTVALGWQKQIVGFYLDTSAADREYVVGEAFSAAGLKVVAIYSDNSTQEIAGGSFAVTKQPSPQEMGEVGVKDVSVTYTASDGQTFDFDYQIFCIPDVNWDTDRLEFGADQNGSGATLELFVTSRSTEPAAGFWGAEQRVEGLLLVRNTDGSFEMYEFGYLLDTSVVSHCYPDGAPEGVSAHLIPDDQIGGGNLIVEINGMTFAATDNNLWHLIVIGWQ